ncbi:UNVERIFIED_CONTAM: hypothetical protein NY603_21610, partial [Bacteroidetes bacterium 56_B9]
DAATAEVSPSPGATESESSGITADVASLLQLAALPEAETAPAMTAVVASAPAALHASPAPPTTVSLGESLLARGMVTAPANKPDPLAPIRRMS